jgi:hypothetical protein
MKIILSCLILLLAACTSKKNNGRQTSLTDFFEPLNWQVSNNGDTFYVFFSPIHDSLVETFEYEIINGDSVNTQHNIIKYLDDTLKWQFNEHLYVISQVDSSKIFLALNNEMHYLNKISDSLMVLNVLEDSFYFRRTLPISSFLIRKKFDFIKGTSGTDSSETLPRKIRKDNLR